MSQKCKKHFNPRGPQTAKRLYHRCIIIVCYRVEQLYHFTYLTKLVTTPAPNDQHLLRHTPACAHRFCVWACFAWIKVLYSTFLMVSHHMTQRVSSCWDNSPHTPVYTHQNFHMETTRLLHVLEKNPTRCLVLWIAVSELLCSLRWSGCLEGCSMPSQMSWPTLHFKWNIST